MKTSKLMSAIYVLYFCAICVACTAYANNRNDDLSVKSAEDVEYYLEDNKPWPGMFFTSDSVVEEYEYDDAYCLLYDDADANMFNVEIVVDLETYQLVCDAHKNHCELVGTLVLNDDYSYDGVQVFTYMEDPEFEMANASAK